MSMPHTVEKVSGSSMAAFDEVLDNIILRPEQKSPYNRIFVVPAYTGITDALLESSCGQEPGVFQYLLTGDNKWERKLEEVAQRLLLVNDSLFADPMLRRKADTFILERVSRTKDWINGLIRGHLIMNREHWLEIREKLASIGEAHSAYNTALKAKRYGVNAKFIDSSRKQNETHQQRDRNVADSLLQRDLTKELPVVTAHRTSEVEKCFHNDRRYGDLTLSRIACLTNAKRAVIHKGNLLYSGDPSIVEPKEAVPIRQSNYQVAKEFTAISKETIHPIALKELSKKNIELQVKCTFNPEHPGTLITNDSKAKGEKIEIVTGMEGVCHLEVVQTDHNEETERLKRQFKSIPNTTLLHQTMIGNTFNCYFDCEMSSFGEILTRTKKLLPGAVTTVKQVALLSVFNIASHGNSALSLGRNALKEQGITPIYSHPSEEADCILFVVSGAQFTASVRALHSAFVEGNPVHC